MPKLLEHALDTIRQFFSVEATVDVPQPTANASGKSNGVEETAEDDSDDEMAVDNR